MNEREREREEKEKEKEKGRKTWHFQFLGLNKKVLEGQKLRAIGGLSGLLGKCHNSTGEK
jgi:hypothetical protein